MTSSGLLQCKYAVDIRLFSVCSLFLYLLFHSFPLLLLFPLCNHWGTGVPLPLNADEQKSNHFSSITQCLFFVSDCVFVFLHVSLCVSLWPSLLALSASLGWSLFLPSSPSLILFISHRDGPQRRSVELSDLNKCLRLEQGLSCGLGCQCGSWCLSHSVVMRRLNESLSKPPPPPSSVCHSLFVASIFNGLGDVRKAPVSASAWRKVEDSWGSLLFSYHSGFYLDPDSMWNRPVSTSFRFLELLDQTKLRNTHMRINQIVFLFLAPWKVEQRAINN